MNISDFDLNLLQVFDAIYSAGSVSRAAERLGVSQPTVSHALQRLRELYRDPLFVRSQGGMAPTAKSDRLATAVREALRVLELALHEGEQFVPARSDRTFRLHMTDIGETIFLPKLVATVSDEAPLARIEVFQLDDKDIAPALESGRIDLALGYIPSLSHVERALLLHERYVVLMRSSHPAARRHATRRALAELDYIVVRSHSATARLLQELGLERRIRLTLPHFMVLPRVIAETDLAVIMPSRLADAFGAMGRYAVWRPRVGLPSFDVSVHWSWRFSGDPGNRWLRERVVALFGES
ncbi:MAG TPA: LysR family transcriptional regulator [Casimicrobiaceae bacterium]|nr:LysR family transcriptional regulator [Casimicrobiaceae bacterium]